MRLAAFTRVISKYMKNSILFFLYIMRLAAFTRVISKYMKKSILFLSFFIYNEISCVYTRNLKVYEKIDSISLFLYIMRLAAFTRVISKYMKNSILFIFRNKLISKLL